MIRSVPSLRELFLLIFVWRQVAEAAQCYYPNGNPAQDDNKPCSNADGAACCPDKWQCLDNGLCYYPSDKLYGRYSCTDKSWKSPHCPSQLCTYNMQAYGAEAITQCSQQNNQWCCDADRVHRDCCTDNSMPFFNLQDGKPYATVGSGAGPSDLPTINSIKGPTDKDDTGGSQSSSSTPSASKQGSSAAPSSSKTDASSASSKTLTPVTSVQTSLSSGSAGIQTIVITTAITPPSSPVSTDSSNPNPTGPSGSKRNVGVIVGCAAGIPLGLALLAGFFVLLRRRMKKNPYPSQATTPDPYSEPNFVGGNKLRKPGVDNSMDGEKPVTYRNEAVEPGSGVAELGSQPIGPGRPISTIHGKAELEGGAGFAPGAVPHAPHLVGVGGGNDTAGTGAHHTPQSSWGSAPPGYSPGQNQDQWAGAAQSQAGQPHGGANTTAGGRYVPYRLPQQGHAQQPSVQSVPEVAELSAVRTPPAR